MAFGKPYKFYLINPDTNEYYKWTRAGGVRVTATKTALVHEPDHWKETQIRWERSRTFFGLARNFSTPYEFVEDGAHILRSIFNTQGVNGKCKLLIDQLVSTDGTYTELYSGDLDFSQFKGTKTGVQINIMEGGLVDTITNALDVQQQVLLDPGDATRIQLDGIYLQSRFQYINVYQQANRATNATPHNIHFIPLSLVTGLTEDPFDSGEGRDVSHDDVGPPPFATNYYHFTCYKTGQFTFSLNRDFMYFLNGTALAPIKLRVYLEIWSSSDPSATMLDQQLLFEDPNWLNPGDSRTIPLVVNYVANMVAGNIAVIYVDDYWDVAGTPPSDVWQITYPESTDICLTITGLFRLSATETKAYLMSELWAKLVDKATDGEYSGTSDYLEDGSITKDDAYGLVPSNLYITVGDAIRGIDTTHNPSVHEDPYFKTTLSDAIKSMFAVAGLTLNLDIPNGEAQLIPLAEVFDKTYEIADLGFVSGLRVSVANDIIFNILNIGYPDSQFQSVLDGKYDYNDRWQWKLPLYKLAKTFDLISPYFSSPYYIESLRKDWFNNITVGTNTDNNIFLIQANPATTPAELFRPQNDYTPVVFEGIGDYNKAVAYNPGLSPKRCLFRNGGFIHSICDLNDADIIRFQSANYNKNLISKLDVNGDIAEITNENISNFAQQLFKPYYLDFEALIPKSLMTLVNANQKGYFTIHTLTQTGKEVVLRGFPMDIAYTPKNDSVYPTKLLLHPADNLEDLD